MENKTDKIRAALELALSFETHIKPGVSPVIDSLREALSELDGCCVVPVAGSANTGWKCTQSPTGFCVYDEIQDPSCDDCLHCGQPDERK